LELDWPAGGTYPSYGLTKPRADFDQALLDRARAAGARVHQATTVTHPELNPAGRVVGVAARQADGRTVGWRAPITLAADGVAARLALAVGRERRPNRPMGIALRTYFRVPQVGEYMESHLELWDGPPGQGRLMPGYGWVFPLADGRVNVGLGTVSSRANTANVNFRDMLERWVPNIPGWRFDPADQLAPPRSAALPMAFNRVPLYGDGLLLLGDAGGMVSPFNGEGIAQAMASGRIAAQTCLGALACRTAAGREQALAAYPRAMADYAGGYFALGRVFVRLIEHPGVMRVCTRYGLGRPTLMKFTMKLLSGLYEPRGGDWMDRMIAALTRLAPAA
jgi:flavin-dependent dehydrogenase